MKELLEMKADPKPQPEPEFKREPELEFKPSPVETAYDGELERKI